MANPKTLAEIIEELQQSPQPADEPSQDNAFAYLQNRERGTAGAEAQVMQEVTDLMTQNPTFRNDLVQKLPPAEQSKYQGERFEQLVTDANRGGLDKLMHDFLGRKRAAAKEELKHLTEEAYAHLSQEINNTAFGDRDYRRADIKYPDAHEPIRCTYTTEGGNTAELKGAKYEPENPTGKVVLVFTGSHSPAAGQIANIKDAYLEAGATVISMDYRGFGQSMEYGKDGNPVETPLSEQSLCQDGRAMYDHILKSIPGVKPCDIILHGFSAGGPVAARVASDIAAETAKKGGAAKEEDHLGGLTLHSPVATSYEAALQVRHEDRMTSFMGWLFGGGHNTRAHMRRLHSNDPALPVHYIGGNEQDWLSVQSTKIDKDPAARFANSSTFTGNGDHLAKNVTAEDPGLREMVQKGRRAQLNPARVKTQAPVEKPSKKPL